jgi:putative NADH-flavin reductase
MRLFVIGASGGVGSRLVARAAAQGHTVTAQTRAADKIRPAERITPAIGAPIDEIFLRSAMAGHDAVAYCLGVDSVGKTSLFSDTTQAVIRAMQRNGIKRLVAITGVGAGDTKGHGGWLYNRIIFPFFTRNIYADKDRQEALIAGSDLDWTIIRPAPFSAKPGSGALQVVTEISPNLQLRSITRDEIADFMYSVLASGRFVGARPFIGHY